MKRTRTGSAITMILSLMLLASTASAAGRILGLNANETLAQGLVTIDEIKKDALLGWHKAYEVNGKCISADIEIGVPEISVVPIVRIGYPPELEPVDVVYNNDDVTVDRQGILVKKESAAGVFWGSGDRFEM
ncbi:MAG: hypothetical protein RR653_11440, partial [Clostridia bacterium]